MSAYVEFNKQVYYTLFPRIVRVGAPTTLTVTDRFKKRELPDECVVWIIPVTQFNNRDPFDELAVTSREGGLSFSYTFALEQQYLVRLLDSERQNLFIEFSVYALEDDLFVRRPYKGDLHLHTTRSDGLETPQHMVCACREHGLDVLALADHNRYEPSLESIRELANIPHRMVALRGEEVHAGADHPRDARCPVHILSLEADYAIAPFTSFQTEEEYETALAAINEDFEEISKDKPWLAALGKEAAQQLLNTTKTRREQLLATFDDPTHTIDAESYVSALDVFEHIRQAGGLSVLCHTQWKHIPSDPFTQRDDAPLAYLQKLIKEKPFEVYEAVSYAPKEAAARNLAQVNLLAEAGHLGTTPLIGITDSHTVLAGWNELGRLYTVMFLSEFSAGGVIQALRENRCVAVEHYEDEDARCYGSYRLSRYAEFLIDYFYPAHDERCKVESALMYRCFEEEGAAAPALLEALCALHQREESRWWAE